MTAKSANSDDEKDDHHNVVHHIRTKRSDYEEGIFGLLYTLSKGEGMSSSKFLVALTIWINAFQLSQFVFTASNWNFTSLANMLPVWRIAGAFKSIQFQYFISTGGFSFYCAILLMLAAVALLCVFLSLYVAYNFKTGFFPYVLPIQMVKIIVAVFITVFYISALNILLLILDCGEDGNGHLVLVQMPDTACWQFPHIPFAVLAVIIALLLFASAMGVAVGKFENDPLATNQTAQATSLSELASTACQTILAVCSVFLNNSGLTWKLVQFACFAFMATILMRRLPFYYGWVNQMQAGCYFVLVQAAMCNLILHFADLVGFTSLTLGIFMTIFTFAFMPFSFVIGFVGCGYQLKRRGGTHNTERRYDGQILIHPRIRSVIHYELASRIGSRKQITQEQIELAEFVLHTGVWAYPKNAYMHLIYANFLLNVKKNADLSEVFVNKARSMNPGLTERFSIFVWDQDKKHRSQSAETGEDTNVVGFVAFNTAFHNATHHLSRVIKSEILFFRAMSEEDVVMSRVQTIMSDISYYRKHARKATDILLSRYGKSVQVLTLYGEYLEKVLGDGEKAKAFYDAARELQAQTKKEEQNRIKFAVNLDEVDDNTDAVIAMEQNSRVFIITTRLCKLLSVSFNDIIGQSVNVIFPPSQELADEKHFMAQLVQKRLLNNEVIVILQHADGHTFPVKLHMTEIQKDTLGRSGFVARCLTANRDDNRMVFERDKPRFVLDTEWRINSFNEQFMRLMDASAAELYNLPITSMIPNFVVTHICDLPEELEVKMELKKLIITAVLNLTIAGNDNRRLVICEVDQSDNDGSADTLDFKTNADRIHSNTLLDKKIEIEEEDDQIPDISGQDLGIRKKQMEFIGRKLSHIVKKVVGIRLLKMTTVMVILAVMAFLVLVGVALKYTDLTSQVHQLRNLGLAESSIHYVCLYARAKRSGWPLSNYNSDFAGALTQAALNFDQYIRNIIGTQSEDDFRSTYVNIMDESGSGQAIARYVPFWTALQQTRTAALILSQTDTNQIRSNAAGSLEWRFIMRNGMDVIDSNINAQFAAINKNSAKLTTFLYALLILSWVLNTVIWVVIILRGLAPLSQWASKIRTDFIGIMLTVSHKEYSNAFKFKKEKEVDANNDSASESYTPRTPAEGTLWGADFQPGGAIHQQLSQLPASGKNGGQVHQAVSASQWGTAAAAIQWDAGGALSKTAAGRNGNAGWVADSSKGNSASASAFGIVPSLGVMSTATNIFGQPKQQQKENKVMVSQSLTDLMNRFKSFVVKTFIEVSVESMRPSTGKIVHYSLRMGHMQMMLILSTCILSIITVVFSLLLSETVTGLNFINSLHDLQMVSTQVTRLTFWTNEVGGGWVDSSHLSAYTTDIVTSATALAADDTAVSTINGLGTALPSEAVFASGLQNGIILWAGQCARVADTAIAYNESAPWNGNYTADHANSDLGKLVDDSVVTIVPSLSSAIDSLYSKILPGPGFTTFYSLAMLLMIGMSGALIWSATQVSSADKFPEIEQLSFLLSALTINITEITKEYFKTQTQKVQRRQAGATKNSKKPKRRNQVAPSS